MIRVTPDIAIDDRRIQYEFIRASGPGGQNVNKVATAVKLRFDLAHASLPDDVRRRLIRLSGRRMTDEGILIIHARRFRTQERNRRDALDRLMDLVRRASERPRRRIRTKPTAASRRRRMEAKQRRSDVKRTRRSVASHTD